MEYKGYLVSVDGYMNMQLANTEEYIGGALSGHLGEVLIRCYNVLIVSKPQSVIEGAISTPADEAGAMEDCFLPPPVPDRKSVQSFLTKVGLASYPFVT
ncbi:unnamed protein product [Caretta caretta]